MPAPQSPTPTDEFTKLGEVGYTVTAYMALQAENAELRDALSEVNDELQRQERHGNDLLVPVETYQRVKQALTRPPEVKS